MLGHGEWRVFGKDTLPTSISEAALAAVCYDLIVVWSTGALYSTIHRTETGQHTKIASISFPRDRVFILVGSDRIRTRALLTARLIIDSSHPGFPQPQMTWSFLAHYNIGYPFPPSAYQRKSIRNLRLQSAMLDEYTCA